MRKNLGLAFAVMFAAVFMSVYALGVSAEPSPNEVNISDLADVSTIQTAIETALLNNSEVIVIGEKTGVGDTLTINIPDGKKVRWQATYSGDNADTALISISGVGEFAVENGANISATTGRAIYADGTSSTVTVSGGTVTSAALKKISDNNDYNATIYANGKVVVTGGTVKNTGNYDSSGGKYPVAIYSTYSGEENAVDISGGMVEATGDGGCAIFAIGDVKIGGGEVKATSDGGCAIFAMCNVEVGSGEVKATGDGGLAIQAFGYVEVKETAIVSATTGRAIDAVGTSSTVTVRGGTVSANTGTAILAVSESSTVTVSGGTVKATGNNGWAIQAFGYVEVKETAIVSATTGYAIYAVGTSSTVTVSGGTVKATGNNGWAIQANGNVEISGNAQVSATTGKAIDAVGTSSTVNVSGGTVEATGNNGWAIYATGASSTVTVSGGTVKATEDGGWAIEAYGDVEVSGNATVSATTGIAILAVSESSTVTVSGGTVEATGNNGWAIQANGNVEISGNAQVSATTGKAIDAVGESSTVTVSGGTVEATGDNGWAISASGNVTVSGGTVSANTGTAIYAYGTSSTVTVRGGTVEATGDNGWAIQANGNVEISGNAQVSATTGTAIFAASNVTVSGGTVSATTGYAIDAVDTSSTVTVSGGTVSATTGRAIYLNGTSSTVTVSGGTVSATTGRAIYLNGTSSTVTVSGGKVEATGDNGWAIQANGNVEISGNAQVSATTGYAIDAVDTSSTVTVSGGTVEATGDNGYAIQASGNVEISGNAQVSATTGIAIYASGASSTVTVSGGTVSATTGKAIDAVGTSSTVTVSGGTVKATGDNGWAISASGNVTVSGGTISANTGTAIFALNVSSTVTVNGGKVEATGNNGWAIQANGNVEISGNAQVSATTGFAIIALESSTVTVSGGLVFAYGTDIIGLNNVIYCVNTDAVTITSPGIVIAWNESAGITAYTANTNGDLIDSPAGATAVWDKKNVGGEIKSGIAYANGENTGFIPIDGITVYKTYTVTFNLNGGTLAAGTLVQMVEEGSSATAPTVTKDGYTLSWDKAFSNITADITVNAVWTKTGGGSGSSGGSGGGYTPSAPVPANETTVPVLKSGDKVEITIENGAQTVTYNGEALKEGKDYTIKDGKLIIDKDKLKELGEIGTKAEITVVDGKGTTLKFTIKVTDTPRISAPTVSGNSFVFNIAGYGNELRLIKLTDGKKTLKDFRIVSDINVRNGKFTLDSTTFSSLADGNYTLTATFDTGEKVNFTIIKKGDKIQFINADLAKFSLTGGTKPNTKDCLYFLEIFIGKRAYNGENLDFNADGKVNTLDVLVLLDFVVSM